MTDDTAIDALVIGSGAAGCVAASKLVKEGFRVGVLSKSRGATGFSSGAVDVASDFEASLGGLKLLSRGDSWRKLAHRVLAKNQLHPYRILSEYPAVLNEGLTLLQTLSSNVALLKRSDDKNWIVATDAGTIKHCAFVPKTSALDIGDLRSGSVVGVVDFSGYPRFDSKSVAKMLQWTMKRERKSVKFKTVGVNFKQQSKMWRTSVDVANDLEVRETHKVMICQLKEAFSKTGEVLNYLLFPPVLSLTKQNEILKAIHQATQVQAFELLSMPPSVLGIRLASCLQSNITKSGASFYEGTACDFSTNNGGIESVVWQKKSGAKVNIHAKIVLLASGRYLAGGLEINKEPKEKLFGLPLWSQSGPIEKPFSRKLTFENVEENHELFRLGLLLDREQRPLDRFGGVFAKNLFAAGSIVQGYDPAKDGTGLAAAALLGIHAANKASNYLKSL